MSSSGNFHLIFRLQVQGDAEVASKFKNVAASMNQLNPAAKSVQGSVTQASNALKSTGQAASSSSSGLKTYHGALTSLGSAHNQAKGGVDAFSGSLGNFSKVNQQAAGGLNQTNTVAKGLVPTMGTLGTEGTKTGGAMQRLTDTFRGNRGLIFSVTMLGSGISEAIGMFQGYQDASDKLAAAKEKLASLEEQGLEHTKEYGEAVKDVADAQKGYNFITRFTIQSFADLVPMSLMLTSSLLEMTSKVGGLSAAKTKLAAAGSKMVSVMTTLGNAMMTFTTRHPLLLLLTLLAGAALALVTNFMGLRDRINELGVAVGNALGPFKGVLEYFGLIGNGALDTANSFINFGQTATAATTDVEKQVLKTGDATKLSFQDQINLMNKMGEEGKNLAFSLGAHLQKQQQDQQAHNAKYRQFVQAMQTGNADIMNSLKLTGEEYQSFSERFQQETEALDEKFGTAVESIIDGWTQINDRGSQAATKLVEEISKIQTEIVELEHQKWDMDKDDDIEKIDQKLVGLYNRLGEVQGKVTDATLQGAYDFTALQEAGTAAIDGIGLAIKGQDFAGAISYLSTAIDGVPEKYRGNFSQIDSIIGNTALNNRQKVAQIISDYGSLENAFQPLIVGAYELSQADAQLATSLDEVAVAARSNMTDMSQAGQAWNTFLTNLKPAQRDLPIIQDLMARVAAGTITHAEALAEAEAAGRDWSKRMGQDVMTSIQNVEKSFIDLGNGTSAMVANVNGQMVNLGSVSNKELNNLSNTLGTTDASMGTTAQTAEQKLANEATGSMNTMSSEFTTKAATIGKTMGAINLGFLGTGQNAKKYIEEQAVTSLGALATAMENAGKTAATETGNWTTAISNFASKAKESIQGVIDSIGKLFSDGGGGGGGGSPLSGDALNKAISNRRNLTNMMRDVQGFRQTPRSRFTGGEGGGGSLTQNAMLGNMSPEEMFAPEELAGATGGFQGIIQQLDQLKAKVAEVWTTFSQFSTSITTYATSMTTSLGGFFTKIGAAIPLLDQQLKMHWGTWSQLSTSIATYSTSMTASLGTFFTTIGAAIPLLDAQVKMHWGTWSMLSTSIATYATSMTTSLGTFFTTIGAAIPLLDAQVKLHWGTWSGFSTSIATYASSMTTALGTFFTKMGQAFPLLDQLVKTHWGTWSQFSTSVSTYSTSMTGAIQKFAQGATSSFTTIQSSQGKLWGEMSKFSTSVSTYSKSMASALQSFASAAVSALNKVASAAKSATNALNSMAAAARRAAQARASVGGMQHGGAFIASAQKGFSGVVNTPTTFKGVRMGEGFAPELVTVQPLTRGTGNHQGPTVSSNIGGRNGGMVEIHLHNEVGGREFQRVIKQVALGDYGLQV